MNKLVLSVSLLITVLLSQTAAADSRHGRQGYNDSRFGGNHSRSYNRSFNRSHNRGFANSYHYGRAGNRRNDFVSISYGNRFNNGYNNRFNNRFNSNFNNGFYNNGYRNRWNRGRNRNRGNSNFVGGLVLGSLLSNRNYSSRSYDTVSYRSAPIREREVVYVGSSTRPAVSATPKRRLLRDLQGDCYDIEISPNGDELRSQIDPAACNF